MKHRFVAGCLAALLALIPAVLVLGGFLLPAQYTATFVGALPDKVARLRETESPRLIFVGGSSVPFSLRSDLIGEALPAYAVVDFGLYAQLGTPVLLDLLLEHLGPGDLVVVSVEQDPQALSCAFSAETVWQAVDGHFELLGPLASGRREALAAAFPTFAGKKWRYALQESPSPTDIYARTSFNAYGDIAARRPANIMPGGFDPNQPIRFDPEDLSEEFVQYLNDFNAQAEGQGAQIFYRFPPMNSAALDCAEGDLDRFYDALSDALDFPVLGDPNRCVLEPEWFYDTNFHLNDSGAVVFTKAVVEDLKVPLGGTSVTAMALPAMPALAAPAVLELEEPDLDCFTYQQTADGWRIDGLTERGRRAEQLTLPAAREGLPVVEVDPELFVGHTALRTLTVRHSIALYDGMFRGCLGLERLVLTGTDPSACTVGDGLREGADLLIQVPAAALDAYRRHYSWQRYSSYLVPDG